MQRRPSNAGFSLDAQVIEDDQADQPAFGSERPSVGLQAFRSCRPEKHGRCGAQFSLGIQRLNGSRSAFK